MTDNDWADELAKDLAIAEDWGGGHYLANTKEIATALRQAYQNGERRGRAMGMIDGYVLVPVEPTVAMIKASNLALREIILSVPEPERKRRWGKPTERGYQISGDEKAAIRYRAMIAAAIDPPNHKGEAE